MHVRLLALGKNVGKEGNPALIKPSKLYGKQEKSESVVDIIEL